MSSSVNIQYSRRVVTYTQQPSVEREASIFSMGGTWANNLISSDSEAFEPDSASYKLNWNWKIQFK